MLNSLLQIQCIRKTRQIILNKKNLHVDKDDVSIRSLTNAREYTAVEQVENLDSYDRLRITLVQDLIKKNRYWLKIRFSSISPSSHNDNLGYIVNPSR